MARGRQMSLRPPPPLPQGRAPQAERPALSSGPTRKRERGPDLIRVRQGGGTGVICANCGTTNLPGARFCMECATPFGITCPSCGATNLPAAKFCSECATPLAGVRAALAAGSGGPAAGTEAAASAAVPTGSGTGPGGAGTAPAAVVTCRGW